MTYFERCLAYLKNNPNGYWFKRKLYGWGWVPVRWQGWLVITIFIIFIWWSAADLTSSPYVTDAEFLRFFAKIIASVAVLVFICYKTGEKPRWQWGPPS